LLLRLILKRLWLPLFVAGAVLFFFLLLINPRLLVLLLCLLIYFLISNPKRSGSETSDGMDVSHYLQERRSAIRARKTRVLPYGAGNTRRLLSDSEKRREQRENSANGCNQ
jgi:chromate transport protein ChrA